MAGLELSLHSLQGKLGAAFPFQRVLLNWKKGTEFKGKPIEGVLFKHNPKVPIMRKHVSHSHVEMTEEMFQFHFPLLAQWLTQEPDAFDPLILVQGNVFIMSSIIIYLAQSFQVMTSGLFRN